jgi:hypothetical protein
MRISEVCLERRAAQRFDFQLPLSIRRHKDAAEGFGVTQNLSACGVFFYTDFAMQQGADVEVTLSMPSEITLSENMRVRCRGKVLRVALLPGESKISVAVHLEHYEYLADAASATSADYDRLLALHQHTVREDAQAANSLPRGSRGLPTP